MEPKFTNVLNSHRVHYIWITSCFLTIHLTPLPQLPQITEKSLDIKSANSYTSSQMNDTFMDIKN
jgi:hypothetical protein